LNTAGSRLAGLAPAGFPVWSSWIARAGLISKLVVLVADAMPTLLGVLPLPASSNSIVKE
jgi:hypothetical protein